jgi:hypothetical protein
MLKFFVHEHGFVNKILGREGSIDIILPPMRARYHFSKKNDKVKFYIHYILIIRLKGVKIFVINGFVIF